MKNAKRMKSLMKSLMMTFLLFKHAKTMQILLVVTWSSSICIKIKRLYQLKGLIAGIDSQQSNWNYKVHLALFVKSFSQYKSYGMDS